MGALTDVDVIRRFNHPQIGQAPKIPTQNSNKSSYGDIFLLVRRAAAAITQRQHKDALIRFRVSWPEVEMIGEFLTDQFPPSNAGLGTDSIQPARSRI